jgi:hypothetical protein
MTVGEFIELDIVFLRADSYFAVRALYRQSPVNSCDVSALLSATLKLRDYAAFTVLYIGGHYRTAEMSSSLIFISRFVIS